MSNWALQLDPGSYISYASNGSLDAATKVWGAFRVYGSFLTGLASNGNYVAIDVVGDSGFTAFKAGLIWAGPSGVMFGVIDQSAIWTLNQITGSLGSLSNTSYYDVRWVVKDGASVSSGQDAQIDIYAAGDLGGTSLYEAHTLASLAALTTSGRGVRRLGCTTDAGFSGTSVTFDWAKIGNDNTYSFEDSQLEEGSGSSVSPSGTINGTFTWIPLAAPAPVRFFRQQTFPRRRR